MGNSFQKIKEPGGSDYSLTRECGVGEWDKFLGTARDYGNLGYLSAQNAAMTL
jgi:hypothetical protein